MQVSPFTFYRGAARIMAADLHRSPTAGLTVQLCGDAHLSNFGGFASPERNLVFDLNDFDETLPGPFEYDVKRMAASFTIAARNNGFTKADAKSVTLASVCAYREAMDGFAHMPTMDIWYAHLSDQDIVSAAQAAQSNKKQAKEVRRSEKNMKKARSRTSAQALSKLGEVVDGRYRIVSQPPITVPLRELAAADGMSTGEFEQLIHDQFDAYRATLQDDRRQLLERFEIVDAARKVVGVGSVGTRALIVLDFRAATRRIHWFSRSRKPPDRYSRTTCPRVATGTQAPGWCTDNDSCRPPVTSTWVGRAEDGRTATTIGDSSAT